MNKLWRLFMSASTGLVCSKCRGSCDNYRDCIKKSPGILLTPLGCLFVSLLLILFLGGLIIEFPTRWLINKKIRGKPIGQKYIDKIIGRIDITGDEDLSKKFLLIYKSPLNEQEEYIYYKYCVKAFQFTWRKKISKGDRIILNELIKFRDEKHEHYLILKLARVK